jgi:hypothetical protein
MFDLYEDDEQNFRRSLRKAYALLQRIGLEKEQDKKNGGVLEKISGFKYYICVG